MTRLKTYVLQEQCKIDGVAPRPVTFDAFCLADAKRKAHSLSLLKGTTLVLSCSDGTGATRERNKWSEIS